ncbi:MAG: hypothetical protein LBB50_00240, partial [Oscillospiraceae bacterium]|nr:hypothetical protein [Oscillospiraceae bacterium]
METWLKEQLKYGLGHGLPALLRYPFVPKTSAELARFREKTGGMVHGICRPSEDYAQLVGAGIGWVREGVTFPTEDDGSLRDEFKQDVERFRRFRANGLKVLAITPSVGFFLQRGIDPRTPEGEARVREIARTIITELRDVVDGLQICNEIGIPRFGHPLCMREAVRFLGVQAEAMAPHKGNVIVGYNSV